MLMPLMASAEEYSGTTGYCTWHLDTETGILKISGEGRMYDYSFTTNAPWHQYLEYIRTVEITDGVTTIGTYSFYECSSLTSITMPNSVEYIGKRAFLGCSQLSSINIPNSITTIEPATFAQCSSLTSISIPNSVTSIKSDPSGSNIRTGTAGAFQGCTNLTSITIPNSVKEIGAYSFCDCPNLKKIIVDDLTAWCNINFEKIRDEIGNPLGYAHHLYLSNDENTEITNLVIPSSVSSISSYAFYGCTGLTTVTIEKRDTPLTFGNGTFDGCDNISDVYCYTEILPDGDGFVISNAT